MVIIIGAGYYSLKEGLNLDLWNKIKGLEIWSLNSIYKIMPYLPSRQLWVDVDFFKHNAHDLQVMYQKGVKLCTKKHPYYAFFDGINQYDCTRDIKNDKDIYIGGLGLVGMFALSLATKEQYSPIFLLGYDFGCPIDKKDERKTHIYQDKIKDLNIYSTGVGRPEIYLHKNGRVKHEVKDFDKYKDYKYIYNVSLYSNIMSYPKISWDEFFNMIKQLKNEKNN